MKQYLVICYAVHEKRIASCEPVDSMELAKKFLATDAKNTFNEEYENALCEDKKSIELIIDEETAKLSSYDGEYIWTWEIIEVSM